MSNSLNVLIADDEESLRYSLGSILKIHGYNVTLVEDGLKAVEAVKNGNFDIAFLDIRMPEMNGVEAFKEIKRFNKKIVVVIMTAYAPTNLMEDAEKEAFLIIDKPFDIDKILKILERIVPGEGLEKSKI